MPIIKSAAKRVRQTIKRKARNQATKRDLRSEVKVLTAALAAKDGKKAVAALKSVQSQLDKAVKKNVLKKNTAARKLANFSAQVKSLGVKTAGTAGKKPAATTTKKAATKKPAVKKPATKKTTTKAAPAKK